MSIFVVPLISPVIKCRSITSSGKIELDRKLISISFRYSNKLHTLICLISKKPVSNSSYTKDNIINNSEFSTSRLSLIKLE